MHLKWLDILLLTQGVRGIISGGHSERHYIEADLNYPQIYLVPLPLQVSMESNTSTATVPPLVCPNVGIQNVTDALIQPTFNFSSDNIDLLSTLNSQVTMVVLSSALAGITKSFINHGGH